MKAITIAVPDAMTEQEIYRMLYSGISSTIRTFAEQILTFYEYGTPDYIHAKNVLQGLEKDRDFFMNMARNY